MKKEMLINVLQPEECRIAIVEDGVLEELYVERTSHESYVGNIYKGRVVNIEPSIQAVFVDFGVGRNGFLHVSDVEPTYFRHIEQRRDDRQGRGRGRGRDRNQDQDRRRGGDSRGHGPRRGETRDTDAPPPAERSFPEDHEREQRRPPQEDMTSFPPPDPQTNAPESLAGWDSVESTAVELESPQREDVPTAAAEASAAPGQEVSQGTSKGRGRKRSRGGARRRRKEPRQPEPEAPANDSAPPSAPLAEPAANVDADSPREKPRLMDSAERWTEEGDGEASSPDDASTAELTSSSSFDDDDLLFFPRDEPATTARPPEAREQPAERPTSAPAESPRPAPVRTEAPRSTPPREEPRYPGQRREEPERPSAETFERDEPDPFGKTDDDRTFALDHDESPQQEDDEEVERFEEERFDEFDDADSDFDDLDEEAQRPSARRGPGGGDQRRPRGRRFGGGRPGLGRPRPLIQDIFKRGQEVIVQVIKEGIGTKGPTLSTYISIAGRYLVLMPSLSRVGVSRKIQDDEQRRRLRDIFVEMQPPKGLGFIIRTAAIDRNKKELESDLVYLTRLWQVVVGRIRKLKSPAEIYQESDMITRTIRDTFTKDISGIWVDEPTAFQHAQEFLREVMPRYVDRLKQHDSSEPLFQKNGIENEIARIQRRHVPLPTGGSIVIDQTEALVAIDVNSGTFRADGNAEETAYQMNLHAAREIARQLRLRDLGGVIVNDFIDMRDDKHRRAVEKALRDAVKRDRARTKVLRISQFGIIEMTRQRIRPSLKRSVYQDCPHCLSTGQVKTVESMSIDVMRMLQLAAHRANVHRIQIRTAKEVANYLLNKKRREIGRLEEAGHLTVHIDGLDNVAPEMLEFTCLDNRDNEVKGLDFVEPRSGRR